MLDLKKSGLKKENGTRKKNAFVVLVRTEWNAAIVDELENGCVNKLDELGVIKIISILVPGAVEIPFALKKYWEHSKKKKRPDAFIALACIIRGGTPHFDYVCKAVSEGITQLNLLLPVPTIFGVLTVDNEEQAKERIGGIRGHKGEEAAIAAIQMINLNSSLKN